MSEKELPVIGPIETAEDYKLQSEINDMRQHANKIIQGIKALNQHDANRAIWELFQNAVDLSDNSCIEVKISDDSLEFSHNGVPFDAMTLDCLFKQVSSKTLEEKKETYDDKDPVGQYGTGFMTSHVFGKELIVDGGIAKGNGYIPLQDFTIDRRTDNWRELAKSIMKLKDQVASLLAGNGEPAPLPYPKTRFQYKFANGQNRAAAQKAIDSLELILPYVMTFNPKLSHVKVTYLDGKVSVYEKNEAYRHGPVMVSPVVVDGSIKEICYITTEDNKTTIVLPMDKDLKAKAFDAELPRLFLYYPLIGTENLGCNFIFHSRQFQPTEPRNALHLKSEYDSNKKEELQNQLLLENASGRIFGFLRDELSKVSDRIHLATVNFPVASDDVFLNGFFKELKSKWIDAFKFLPFVETKSGPITPVSATFLAPEILLLENGFESCFPIAEMFYGTIPSKNLIKDWTAKLDEWLVEDIGFIKTEDLVKNIESKGSLDSVGRTEDLKRFYQCLISNEKSHFFSQHRLLPNIFGDFRLLSGNDGLNNPLNIGKELIEIANIIMPDAPKRHINSDFLFNLELSDYNRKSYGTEILAAVSQRIDDNLAGSELDKEYLDRLLEYVRISGVPESSSAPAEMARLISRFYGRSEELTLIVPIEDDKLEIRAVQKKVVRLMLNDLIKKDMAWVGDNIGFLAELLALSPLEAYEDLFAAMKVFPNQLNELCLQMSLSIDEQIPDEIKDLYDLVLKPDRPVRAGLVHDDFAGFLKVKTKKSVRDVTEKIEGEFFGESDFINISDHPFRPQILGIVEAFKSNPDYTKYYPLLFSQRSSILVSLANGDDSFAILSLPQKRISDLAKLVSDPNFEQIVELGRAAVLAKQHENANFEHKYMLGRHMEAILRKGLEGILADEIKADTKDVQNGQDIIITVSGNPIYYIEVKSRWDSDNPIRMSKNQTKRAFEKKDNYALCSVDLVRYKGGNALNVSNIDEIEDCMYFGRDIGYKVERLISIIDEESEPDLINLEGDFRTRIPMSYVEKGESLKTFETYLIRYLQSIISSRGQQANG
ncbi:protein NO VEIN domain-containing protein [Chryseobacterium shandongense]|uniref:protein NO VEIN domain-containing protein n=1 Tax=Chryseobacterium shandongense TaxID=1493872 RepID=UPI000F509417|nr:DUF3883 domain-containing protein [Chryseobacterium shandongense]AZA56284.1 DUF3883 domain-containing protein [Chryseobacterium shandongense]